MNEIFKASTNSSIETYEIDRLTMN